MNEAEQMRRDWSDFCKLMGVPLDTHEAVAYQLQADRSALVAALAKVVEADDEFRASLAPGVEKDPVTLACEEAKSILVKRPWI